jgi:hypothetical protein
LRPGKTFCEFDERCKVSPQLDHLALKPVEPIGVRPTLQGIVDLAARQRRWGLATLNPSHGLA